MHIAQSIYVSIRLFVILNNCCTLLIYIIALQLWTLEQTCLPWVYKLAIKDANQKFYLTVPVNASNGVNPTLEKEITTLSNHQQLWRLITSGDGANSMIQNYSVSSGGGLVLDTRSDIAGQVTGMWERLDNDNQKWYITATD